VKKVIALVLLAASGAAGWALDWGLPTWSLKTELSHGSTDDEEEAVLAPSALRSTTTLRLAESADPLDLGMFVRFSAKDYLLQAGDYRYAEVGHDGRLALSDRLRVGYTLGLKRARYPELDTFGQLKDYLAVRTALDARLSLGTGSAFEVGIEGRWEPYDLPEKSRQRYAANASLGVRLGQWDLDARIRSELRLPLGDASLASAGALHTASLTLAMNPNRTR
jgi:hypothetical protein